MVEISLSGSGEGPGRVTAPGYSTTVGDELRQGPRRPHPACRAPLHRRQPLEETANPLRSTSIHLESAPRAPPEPTRGATEDAPRLREGDRASRELPVFELP